MRNFYLSFDNVPAAEIDWDDLNHFYRCDSEEELVSKCSAFSENHLEFYRRFNRDYPKSLFGPPKSIFSARDYLVRLYSWAVPSSEAIRVISDYCPRGLLEIGAGTGYWSFLVKELGVDVLAYDEQPDNNTWINNSFMEVKEGDEEVAALYPDRTLFLCWPPYNSPFARNALSKYEGNTLIYIGEGKGGCCADDEFFQELERWQEVETLDIPQYSGLHDELRVYRR